MKLRLEALFEVIIKTGLPFAVKMVYYSYYENTWRLFVWKN
jgi:hypothetical protein